MVAIGIDLGTTYSCRFWKDVIVVKLLLMIKVIAQHLHMWHLLIKKDLFEIYRINLI